MSNTGDNLPRLREVAMAATQKEWRVYDGPLHDSVFRKGRTVCTKSDADGVSIAIAYCDYMTQAYAESHANFIATFNPSLILDLLLRLESAEAAVKRAEEAEREACIDAILSIRAIEAPGRKDKDRARKEHFVARADALDDAVANIRHRAPQSPAKEAVAE